VCLLALLVASTASADSSDDMASPTTYFNAGLLLSVTGRPSGGMFAYGVEASLHHFFNEDYTSGVGLFGQFQGTNADHSRYCGGLQATYEFVGMELGLTYENASRDFARTTSLHVAPFVSAAGFVTLGLRVGIPLSGSDGPRPGYGRDIGVVLALKYPLAL